MRTCTNCKVEQPVTEFKADPRMTSGLSSWCRSCGRKAAKERYWRDPEKARAKVRKRSNKESEYARVRHLRHIYGLTPESHAALLASQDGRCAVCRTDKPGGKHGTWHTDHDHTTKVIRGILCHSCNIGLGHFRDNPDLLRAAIEYLQKVR